MKVLIPVALAAAILAMPAPAHKLSAELQAGAAPFRIAFAYRVGLGRLLSLDVHAGMTLAKSHPVKFSGGINLSSPLV